jgi:hypothetical protein
VRDDRVSLDAGAISYQPGDQARIRVRLRDEDGRLMPEADARILLSRDGKKVATLPLVPDERGGGVFRAVTGPLEKGRYEVGIEVEQIPVGELRARTGFVVRPPKTSELTELSRNREILAEMATHAHGFYFEEEDIDGAVSAIEPLSRGKVIESTTTLWQSYWWFAAVILLLTMDWGLRKWEGML